VTQPIDIAYVDIVAREKSRREFERDIDRTMDNVEKSIQADLDKIDNSFDDLFSDIDNHFKKLEKSVDGRLKKSFNGLGDAAEDAFQVIENKMVKPLSKGFDALGDFVGEIGGLIGDIGGKLGGLVASSPLIGLVIALIPAIIALAAALSNLIGLVGILPASLGVLVAAIVPVVVAFQGFGEAVSAVASGDIEKIDEALKKLSPSAASVVREIGNLLPMLKAFQRSVQEAFFSQIRGGITQLLGTVLPAIGENFNRVAASMGKLVSEFIKFATSINALNALNDLLDTTSRIVDKLSGPLFRLFDSLALSVSAGLPFVERLAEAIGRALDKFSAFLNQAIETGEFDKFIEDAIVTVKELIALGSALVGLFGTIFSGTEESGHDFLKTLTDLTIQLDKFFQSAEGQDTLKALSLAVQALGFSLMMAFNSTVLLVQIFSNSLKLFETIGRGVFDLGEKIGQFFEGVPAKFEQFKAFLASLPGIIGQAISNAFNTALQTIGVTIGLIMFSIQELPGRIITFFATLPERIGEAVSGTGPTLLEILRKAMDDALAFLTSKFAEVVAFVQSVPDRIAALGPIFLQAGKNLIQSFMNGFRSVGSFIGDIAGDIVGAVRGFLNRAIDKINSGIAAIDNILPGNLGRIPRLAKGAVVGHRPGGTLAVVGEGNEDEAVAPLSKLEEFIRNALGGDGAGAMTVSFGPNSIVINFSGVVPTEGEARTVGAAVADGITSKLATRNVRTQLRTV
jgi:phage-related protein